MAINAVTFDLWQTLINDEPELGKARSRARLEGTDRLLRRAGEDYIEAQLNEAYQSCSRTCQGKRALGKDIAFLDQVKLFLENVDANLPERLPSPVVTEIAEVYAESLFHGPPPLHPDAQRVLRKLKEKGYHLGLISNTGMTPGSTFRKYLEQVGILGYFDDLTFSDEVLLAKPAAEIFRRSMAALGVLPEDAVHVGDDLRTDVEGARAVGMKTVWVPGLSQGPSSDDGRPDVAVQSLSGVSEAVESLATASSRRLTDS